MPRKRVLPKLAQENLKAISELERKLMSRRPTSERLGDRIAGFFGSIWFIVAQVLGIGMWIEWNIFRTPFDPYPFPLLSLVIDIEFLLLTTFVLMNQKYQSRRNEHWAHLDLQLSMLTEQEVTKNLQLLDRICRHIGAHAPQIDEHLKELAKPTPLAEFLGEIEKAIGNETKDEPKGDDSGNA